MTRTLPTRRAGVEACIAGDTLSTTGKLSGFANSRDLALSSGSLLKLHHHLHGSTLLCANRNLLPLLAR